MPRQTRRSASKPLIATMLVVAIVVAGGLYLHFHNRNPDNLVNSKSSKTVTGTTSTPTEHGTTPSNGSSASQNGGVIDKNGQSSASLPPSSEWVSSNSGNITLQLPSPNSTIKSGDELTGLAKVSDVQFILKDDSVGQIAQGNLSVVNGKFSGVLQFTPHASSGKLDIYYPNPANGAEQDIVEINVNFDTSQQ